VVVLIWKYEFLSEISLNAEWKTLVCKMNWKAKWKSLQNWLDESFPVILLFELNRAFLKKRALVKLLFSKHNSSHLESSNSTNRVALMTFGPLRIMQAFGTRMIRWLSKCFLNYLHQNLALDPVKRPSSSRICNPTGVFRWNLETTW